MYFFDIANANFEEDYLTIQCHKDVVCPIHLHYSMEVICVTKGEILMRVGDDVRRVDAGKATIVLPLEPHSFETPCASECFVIVFSPTMVADFYQLIEGKAFVGSICTLSPSLLTALTEKLPEQNRYNKTVFAKAILYPLFSEFLSQCTLISSKHRYEGSAFLEAVRYISLYFRSRDVSLSATATALGVHPVYLSRIFKESCGIQFTKYINSVRASWAARLLRENPERNISEIAYDAGFGSIRNFNREFKTLYGTSPEAFRRDVREG